MTLIHEKLLTLGGIVLLISLLFLPVIIAVPPVTNVQQFSEGYEIQVPQDNILKINDPYSFEFHVYNISTGLPIISGAACYFHLYNSTGNHVVELTETIAGADFDYSFYVNKENFSKVEHLYYNIQCNSSILGGFHSSIVEVTYLGKKLSEATSILYIGFLGLLILAFFLNFYGMSFLPARNQVDKEGKIMSVTYLKYFRNVLWMTGYFLFIGIFYISSNLAFSFLEEELVAKTLFMIFRVSFMLAPIVIIVWIIWIFASMFHDKEFQRMLNRGIFPQGNI